MIGTVLILISSLLLLIQCMGFYEFIPLLSFSFFSQDILVIYFIHSCICKWGLPFAVIGLGLGLICLIDNKKNKFELKQYTLKYGIFFTVLFLLSIL